LFKEVNNNYGFKSLKTWNDLKPLSIKDMQELSIIFGGLIETK